MPEVELMKTMPLVGVKEAGLDASAEESEMRRRDGTVEMKRVLMMLAEGKDV